MEISGNFIEFGHYTWNPPGSVNNKILLHKRASITQLLQQTTRCAEGTCVPCKPIVLYCLSCPLFWPKDCGYVGGGGGGLNNARIMPYKLQCHTLIHTLNLHICVGVPLVYL